MLISSFFLTIFPLWCSPSLQCRFLNVKKLAVVYSTGHIYIWFGGEGSSGEGGRGSSLSHLRPSPPTSTSLHILDRRLPLWYKFLSLPSPPLPLKKKMAAIIFDKKILSLLCRLVIHLTSYWISNVKGVVWVNRTREKVNFELGDDMKKADFSVLSRSWGKDKTSFFSPLLCSKFTILLDQSAFSYFWIILSIFAPKFYFTSGVLENPGNMLITALLKMPLKARWFRISPRFPNGFFGLRFEVYGCSVKKQPILYEGNVESI